MKEQLIRYVDLLFAGAPHAGDIRQEILQNTLDRYDDLISQGKTPEAAYSLAISGIGDIHEILNDIPSTPAVTPAPQPQKREVALWRKILKAFAIFLYIICPIPLFVLSELGLDTIGLCGTLAIVALATALICIAGSGKFSHKQVAVAEPTPPPTPQQELYKAISSVVSAVGVCAYFIVSFLTQAWHITWLIFLIIPALKRLIQAILDLTEAK